MRSATVVRGLRSDQYMDLPRPLMRLGKYNREYPEAWSIVDRLRADRGKGLPWWPLYVLGLWIVFLVI
jgi:hypothetical protein